MFWLSNKNQQQFASVIVMTTTDEIEFERLACPLQSKVLFTVIT